MSEWDAGQVGVHDPATGAWQEWRLPGDAPQAYAVYVDDRDIVWLTDFGANAIVRFDPATERFDPVELPSEAAAVRQLHGRPGEVWGAESRAGPTRGGTGGGRARLTESRNLPEPRRVLPSTCQAAFGAHPVGYARPRCRDARRRAGCHRSRGMRSSR